MSKLTAAEHNAVMDEICRRLKLPRKMVEQLYRKDEELPGVTISSTVQNSESEEDSINYLVVDESSSKDFVFLHLWHGREIDEANEDMDDSGFYGPVLGPFMEIQGMYTTYLRCMDIDEKGNDLFLHYDQESGCIFYDGKAYGAYSVLSARNVVTHETLAPLVEQWDNEKANK
jgi:hypothetical protein